MDTPQPSRRTFFHTTAFGAGALSLPLLTEGANAADPPAPPAAGAPDFTLKSPALEPDNIVASACQFCNSLCGLKVHLKAGRVIDIRGEERDPVQAGELCVKGPMMAQLVYLARAQAGHRSGARAGDARPHRRQETLRRGVRHEVGGRLRRTRGAPEATRVHA